MSSGPDSAAPDGAAAPTVAVIGGGVAGMTAALKLRKAGFAVTLYERKAWLGGNLSSETSDGVAHDVYPHMFCDWYLNFWGLLEELGLDRTALFEPRMSVMYFHAQDPRACLLQNATTLEAALANLKSGVLSPEDMFLWGYSMLDLAAQAFDKQRINRLDVNGFIYSRGYANDAIANLHNYLLTLIWSIQSNVTAASSYQEFIRHTFTFPVETPFCWLLKGALSTKLIAPFEEKLGCEILKGRTVHRIALTDGKLFSAGMTAQSPRVFSTPSDAAPDAKPDERAFDFVVIATPAEVTAKLVMAGEPQQRIVDQVPELTQLQTLRSVAIPVVDAYFKRKIPDPPHAFPAEQAGFEHSAFGISVLDISQLWADDPNMNDRTALVVAASDGDQIPSLIPEERGYMMINELWKARPWFKTGDHWGDPDSDLDWEKTRYRSNDDNKLFINDVQSWSSRPLSSYADRGLHTVFFAGDCCDTDVDMATVEAAVESGLMAAQALQQSYCGLVGKPPAQPITVATHRTYSTASLLATKLLLMPAAYWAAAISAFRSAKTIQEKNLAANEYAPSSAALELPLRYAQDFLDTSYWLAKNLTAEIATAKQAAATAAAPGASQKSAAAPAPPAGDPHFTLTELGARGLMVASQVLQAISDRQPARGETSSPSPLTAAAAEFASQAWRAARAAFPAAPASPPAPAPPRRRGRVKP